VNSSGAAHARNARRIVQAARKQDRRLAAALLAAARTHTPEARQLIDGARTRMARKPTAVARELLRNFPKGRRRRGGRRRRRKGGAGGEDGAAVDEETPQVLEGQEAGEGEEAGSDEDTGSERDAA